MERAKQAILEGQTVLGLELGSTRIKAVLIDGNHKPIAFGGYVWENRLENGFWTYHIDDIWRGIRECYADLAKNVRDTYGVTLTKVGAMGFSAMMHGYMAFDKNGTLLVPFRTWRNSTTKEAAEALTSLFNFNIPQRWSIAHLYQAILNGESHVADIDYVTTLAGYVHWKLTGQKVLGIGDASGMFPIDSTTKNYDVSMMEKFDRLIRDKGFTWRLADIFPKVLTAGTPAGTLTAEGAKLLDVSGQLMPRAAVCPPEGDAGTGMTATNSVAVRTGNVSAGTSVFAMVVTEKPLEKVYPEIDMVTTPDGSAAAMVHANNCTSDLNAWVGLFREVLESFGVKADTGRLFELLYQKALEGEADCAGLLSYGFLSGENIMGVENGRPLFVRKPDSKMTLANFMRAHLYSALGALKVGMDILCRKENVKIDSMVGHGGLFKTENVGQRIMAAAVGAPVAVMETAGEGGPWGEALLAAYMYFKDEDETLKDYLEYKVFRQSKKTVVKPLQLDMDGFERYMERFKKGIGVEKAAEKLL